MQEMEKNKTTLIEQIKGIKIFQYLSEKEREHILDISKIIQFDEKEMIITEGETSPYFYAVLEGTVNITVKETGGKDVFISPLGSGDVFGEAAMFLNTKRTASVISSDAILIQIERTDLIDFIKKHSNAGVKIMLLIIYSLLNKLRDANQEIAFERKTSFNQEEIDTLIGSYSGDEEKK